MTTSLKLRRGTTAQHASFTGAEGEVTVDTTKDTVVVHDGATVGGFPLAKEQFLQTGLGATARTIDAKLKDFVSVQDFGAVGDGVTSDDTAIAAAIATGKPIYFPKPASYYKVTSAISVTVPFVAGLYKVFDSTASITFGQNSVTEVYPEWFGAVPNDTIDCTGAVVAAMASVSGVPIKFQPGSYKFSSTLNVTKSDVSLVGCGFTTRLHFTGSGNCVSLEGGIPGFNRPRIEGFLIDGNASATNGIYTNNVHYGICRNVVIKNVSVAGFRSYYGVYWNIENFFMGNNFGSSTTQPQVGMYLGLGSDPLASVTAYTITNANIANCTSSGIDINNGWTNTIIGGAVEANGSQGLFLGGHDNLINGLYVEANTTNNITVTGSGNNLVGVWCVDSLNTPIVFTAASSSNHVLGGVYGAITISSGATRNEFTSTRLNGVWTDNGSGTVVNNLFSLNLAKYIQPTFVVSWANNATFPYETFTSSGANITSAINTTGFGIANTNTFKLNAGATYLFQWKIVLNSGALPGFVVSTNSSPAATAVSVANNNVYMFTPASDGDYYFTLRTEDGVASNFSCSGINVKQIN